MLSRHTYTLTQVIRMAAAVHPEIRTIGFFFLKTASKISTG